MLGGASRAMMRLIEAALAEADCSAVDEFDKEALRIINHGYADL